MKSKYGWRHLFYLWVKTKDRSVRLDVSDCSCYKDLEKMGNIAKRLGSIFNLNFVTELDIDRPTTGTYNIELKPEEIEHIDNKEETDGTYNIELKPKEIEHIANKEETESTLSNNSAGSKDSFDEEDNIDVQSLLNEKLADIATYIEKNEKINKNKEFIKIKLIEVFSNLSEYKLDILVRQCMYYLESFDLEAQFYLSEVECAWTVIKEKCPTADYNDSYIFRAFISYLDLSLTLDPTKKDKLI
jgi:archaellin